MRTSLNIKPFPHNMPSPQGRPAKGSHSKKSALVGNIKKGLKSVYGQLRHTVLSLLSEIKLTTIFHINFSLEFTHYSKKTTTYFERNKNLLPKTVTCSSSYHRMKIMLQK